MYVAELQPLVVPLILVMNDEYWLPFCLKAMEGWFDRYVIYDIGSTDRTPDIIDWFVENNKDDAEIFVRRLPHVAPIVQGAFRNSMIAEARSDWYFILDADEVYDAEGGADVVNNAHKMNYLEYDKGNIYGVNPRIEVCNNLTSAYGQSGTVSHHRLYHRTAIFYGPHPGEAPFYKQKPGRNEVNFKYPHCYHFHNAARSSKDEEVPKRVQRRMQKTYHPGDPEPIEILKKLPILRKQIEDFPVNPELAKLQREG